MWPTAAIAVKGRFLRRRGRSRCISFSHTPSSVPGTQSRLLPSLAARGAARAALEANKRIAQDGHWTLEIGGPGGRLIGDWRLEPLIPMPILGLNITEVPILASGLYRSTYGTMVPWVKFNDLGVENKGLQCVYSRGGHGNGIGD